MSDVAVRVDVAALLAAGAAFNRVLAEAGDPRTAVPATGGVPGPSGGTTVALAELLGQAAATTSGYIERFRLAGAAAIQAAADATAADG